MHFFRCVTCSLFALSVAAGCSDDTSDPADGDEGGSAEGGSSEGGAAPEGGGDVGGSAPLDPCAGFATDVVEVTYGQGAGFGQDEMPGIVLGAPRGTGKTTGSLHVVALGNGGSITLSFGDQTILDGDGPDFIVFENAFYAGGDESAPFAELGTVEVSDDGETWATFPCVATEPPYETCAGWTPVYAGSEGSTADPHDPVEAGGDAFDLADVGLSSARFVRITDRPDTKGLNGSFDLDAVSLVHWDCEP